MSWLQLIHQGVQLLKCSLMVANLSGGSNNACHFRNEIGNAFILVLWVRHIYFFHFNLYLVDCVYPHNLNPCPWSPCCAFDLREFTFSLNDSTPPVQYLVIITHSCTDSPFSPLLIIGAAFSSHLHSCPINPVLLPD